MIGFIYHPLLSVANRRGNKQHRPTTIFRRINYLPYGDPFFCASQPEGDQSALQNLRFRSSV
jgi:hypothetical protein